MTHTLEPSLKEQSVLQDLRALPPHHAAAAPEPASAAAASSASSSSSFAAEAAPAPAGSATGSTFTTAEGFVIALHSLESLAAEDPTPELKAKRPRKRRAKDAAPRSIAPAPVPEPDTAEAAATGADTAEREMVVAESSEPELLQGSAQHILTQLIASVQPAPAQGSDSAAVLSEEQQDPKGTGADAASAAAAAASAPTALEGGVDESITLGMALPEPTAEQQARYSQMGLKEGDTCPHCGQGQLLLRHTEHVDFLGCSNFPQCKVRIFIGRLSQVQTLRTLHSTCPKCSQSLAVKKGRYGIFIGCSNYPECTYIYKEQEKLEQEITCPICHKGILQPRRARSGRTFWGCSHYPQCSFVLPGRPELSPCPECGFPVRFHKKVKAGIALVCGNSLCKSRRSRKYELLARK